MLMVVMPQFISSSQLYREAVARLAEVEIPNAKQEAMWIVEAALGVDRLWLHTHAEDPVDLECYQRVMALIERRVAHEPLQYVLGSQEFCGLDIMVKPGVLIPRPESELLVEEAISLLGSHPRPVILDVGTGSGCLAISLAGALKNAVVIASDRSLVAIEIAKMNAQRYGLQSRILWVVGDLLTPLLSSGLAGKVTAIIANLPYISHDEWDQLSPDVKDFEPHLALDGGPDGLDVYRGLLQEAHNFLASDGVVLMEIGMGQAERVSEEISALNVYELRSIQADSQGIPRMVCVKRVSP